MQLKNDQSKSLPFYICISGIFLIMISPLLFSAGMFMDGLIYAVISKNLANGLGSFWYPHLTNTLYPAFHEHPPLALGLESILFRLFGQSDRIEKIYSLLTIIVEGFIIIKIWKTITNKTQHGWLPLLFWISIPLISWTAVNNMLENTMSIFVSLFILFYLQSFKKQRYLSIFLAGFMLSLGFLTKGLVAFFPWTFPFLLWLCISKSSVSRIQLPEFTSVLLHTILLIFFTFLPLGLLCILMPEAKDSLLKYFTKQVIGSLQKVVTVDSRFFIVIRLFKELLPAIGIGLILLIIAKTKKFPFQSLFIDYKLAITFFLLGLCGVLPIMVSLKQSGFYIIATLPFFAIAFALFFLPLVDYLISIIHFQSNGFRLFKWTAYGLLLIGTLSSFYHANSIGRDKTKLKDTFTILDHIPANSTISIPSEIWQDWGLHAYYARYKNISLDPNTKNKYDFFLFRKDLNADSIKKEYEKIPLPTSEFDLYKRKL